MWTNVFKIGGLHQISWFQFLPYESDLNPQQDRSLRENQKDDPTLQVISSHLQLQKEGFLSTWTNSFVGPWDPSQGPYNPDEKIKLWLFLPGCRSSVVDTAQAFVTKLRVTASGLWLAPGDSEEVAAALSQALRNCIERALIGLSYMRFGDVFTKYHPFLQSEELIRRGQSTIEFLFAATTEAVFVHAIITAKLIRTLSRGDLERVLKFSSNNANERLSVIVSPHGMHGKLIGVCSNDLVKQVYLNSGKCRTSNGITGLPYHDSQVSNCWLRGQNCYVEVAIGVPNNGKEHSWQSNSSSGRAFPKNYVVDSNVERGIQKGSSDILVRERKFIYPSEAVLIPMFQTSFARSSLKRFWLQNWIAPPLTGSSLSMHRMNTIDREWVDHDDISNQDNYDSGSNSNNSSISSLSSNSSDNDYKMNTKGGDLEADADSLTCKNGSKRTRAAMIESYGQVGMVVNASLQSEFKFDNASVSVITGVGDDQNVSQWDWDDDDNGIGIDIQTLLSEFGDFGDFFENDYLPFGEPPGTAESQTLVFYPPDCGDAGGSPDTGIMDVSNQMTSPVGFSSFESINPLHELAIEECFSQNQEVVNKTLSSVSTGEFDHLLKAEALMTVAPEYGGFRTSSNEVSSSIFKSPYFPKHTKAESSNASSITYVYGATPPSSPCLDGSDENPDLTPNLHSEKLYAHVESDSSERLDRKFNRSNNIATSDAQKQQFSALKSTNALNSVQRIMLEGTSESENILSLTKTVFVSELDCIMFQAFMRKTRYSLSSSTRLTENSGLNQFIGDSSTVTENISSKYEIKKKESAPVRNSGDIDRGDGSLNPPVGVWRSVGIPIGVKSNSIDVCPSLPSNSYSEEGMLSYAQRQPLQEFLDGMALLVQQATSFVDVAFDADCGDGPYGWLALQEQFRRGLSCGPYMVHAGCGGSLSSCHSLDIAGMELIDPLSVNVLASSAISLLHSDIKTALKSAFGILDGPLSITDWCKGNGQSSDAGTPSDEFSLDYSSNVSLFVGESMSPSLSSSTGFSVKDGSRVDETCQRRSNQEIGISVSEQQFRPSLFVLPLPAILVGYQDDWLKTSTNSLQLWEKAPFEPYALQKHMNYYVVCPDIDPLTSAADDFFQQLGTVYGACNLGTHSPVSVSNQMDVDSGKWSSDGFVLLDCPQSMKMESSNASLVGSISDYFLSLSNGWDLTSFLKSLSKVLKTLKLGPPFTTTNSKEGNSSPCTVIYVVCPFPEPAAVLKTVIESSVALGSNIFSSEKRLKLHNHVSKALNCSTVVDESSSSSIITLSGFAVPKLVLQIVTVDAIFRVTSPALNELALLKEISFTVYNKARRVTQGSSFHELANSSSSSLSSRSHPMLMQMASPGPGMWKDCAGTWDKSWYTKAANFPRQDDVSYMFEPLFILSEPGSLNHGVFGNLPSDSSKAYSEDSGESDGNLTSVPPNLHCCYGWTEDWRWIVCIWTDSRGELLDSHIFPFGGISSRNDTTGLQCIFVQILQHGCQILQAGCSDTGCVKPRDIIITRIGYFYELECQEWQNAIYSVGGSDVKKWPLQLRRSVPDCMTTRSNIRDSVHQHEMNSPTPLYSASSKSSGRNKGALGQPISRKQLAAGPSTADNSKRLLQLVQSISLVTLSIDHSLYLISQADSSSPGVTQNTSTDPSGFLGGFSSVKSLDTTSASYVIIPSPSMRFLPPTPLQLPTCLTAESPPLAHLLHSKGSAIPLSTGFVVSKSVPSMRRDSQNNSKEEWPSVLSINLIDYYGESKISRENKLRGKNVLCSENKDYEIETHLIVESVAAELHALSWMTASPVYLGRRSVLPFHCDMVMRLRRLLHFADKELSKHSEKSQG